MTKANKDIKKSGGGIFRVFEFITEVIGWVQIVASPLLIGLAVGAIIYFTDPTTTRLVIGITVASVGLVVGIIWATKQWKDKGTIWFMSRVMATPGPDKVEEKRSNDKTKKDSKEKSKR